MTTAPSHIHSPEYPGYDSRAIANAMLLKARAKFGGDKLTAMQLIKLVYLAHGWSLALREHSLVSDRPQAWQFGPVYPKIYKKIKGRGSSAIHELLKAPNDEVYYPHGISPKEELLVDDILKSYGTKSAFSLSAITHKDGTPWHWTQEQLGLYQTIPEDEMRSHFKQLVEQRNIPLDRYID